MIDNHKINFRNLRIAAVNLSAVTIMILVIFAPIASGQGDEVVDRLIAVVGEEIILESEVYQNAQSIALQQGSNVLRDPAEFQKLREKVLQEMINQKVLLAKAREDSIVVEPRSVDRELENRLSQIIKNVGSEEKLEEMYGYSIRRIRRDFRSTVEDNLMVERVKMNYLQDVRVSRSEIEDYFKAHPDDFPQMNDAIELAHILKQTGGNDLADSRALATADSIYNAIKNGSSFDSLAYKLSADRGTAKNYGKIGWTEKGDLVSDYEEAALALNPGEISRPIKSNFGFHIIRMDEKRDDKISTSHILVVPKVTSEDEQPIIENLNSIRDEILNGLDFGEAAEKYSDDLESAKRQGYLGWFALDDMPDDFREEVKSLAIDEISHPFKTQYGYHLVKVLNRRDARALTLDQDWEMISQLVLNNKKEQKYTDWLNKLKERYYIEIKAE